MISGPLLRLKPYSHTTFPHLLQTVLFMELRRTGTVVWQVEAWLPSKVADVPVAYGWGSQLGNVPIEYTPALVGLVVRGGCRLPPELQDYCENLLTFWAMVEARF